MYFWLRLEVGLTWTCLVPAVVIQLITLTGVEVFDTLLVALLALVSIAVVIGLFVGVTPPRFSSVVADLTPQIGPRRAMLSKVAMGYALAVQVAVAAMYGIGSSFTRAVHPWTRSTTPQAVHLQHLFTAWSISAIALGFLIPAAFLAVERLRTKLASPPPRRKKRAKRSQERLGPTRSDRYGLAVRSRNEPLA